MKRIFFALLIVLFASPAFSSDWCEWDGSQGINCQSDRRGYIYDSKIKVSSPSIANQRGWFKVTVTEPVVESDQVKADVAWSKVDNDITKTWNIRDLTEQEIQDRNDWITAKEGLISREMYYVLKWLIDEGVISSTNINNAPAALKAAYQARGRLEAQ